MAETEYAWGKDYLVLPEPQGGCLSSSGVQNPYSSDELRVSYFSAMYYGMNLMTWKYARCSFKKIEMIWLLLPAAHLPDMEGAWVKRSRNEVEGGRTLESIHTELHAAVDQASRDLQVLEGAVSRSLGVDDIALDEWKFMSL